MTTFIELKSDKELLAISKPYSRIVIVGCRDCANVSFAYSFGHALATRVFDRGIVTWEPFAIRQVLRSVEELLRSIDLNASVELETPCILTPEKDLYMATNRTDINAILCITCLAGKVGIEKTVGGGVPVLSAVSTVGLIQPYIDGDASCLRVDRKLSTIIRFPAPLPDAVDLSEYWTAVNREQ
jgi:hypothetical protein